ncbi:MAG: hypothetical protein WEA10_00915 [Actinomycetota bacterium]
MIGHRMIASLAVGIAAVLTLAPALGACGGDDAPPPALPTSAFGVGEAEVTDGTTPDAVDAGDTDGDAPGSDQEASSEGSSARLELRGDIDEDLRLTAEQPAMVGPPPGGIGVTWSEPLLNDRLTIAGVSFTGIRDTDPTTIVTLFVTSGGAPTLFLSNSGECAVTIDAVSTGGMRGSLRCRNLQAETGGETIDLAGTFAVEV